MKKSNSTCFCINLRRASLAITQYYDTILEPSGLKITQYSVLKTIGRLGPVSITSLARELNLDRTTLGKNLRLLQQKTFIGISTGQDQRQRTVKLTNDGNVALALAAPFWEKAQARLSLSLGQHQLDILTSLLAEVETSVS